MPLSSVDDEALTIDTYLWRFHRDNVLNLGHIQGPKVEIQRYYINSWYYCFESKIISRRRRRRKWAGGWVWVMSDVLDRAGKLVKCSWGESLWAHNNGFSCGRYIPTSMTQWIWRSNNAVCITRAVLPAKVFIKFRFNQFSYYWKMLININVRFLFESS